MPSKGPKGQIYWKSLLTGATGQGEITELEAAQASAEQANKELKGKIIHVVLLRYDIKDDLKERTPAK